MHTDADEKHQQIKTSEDVKQDVKTQHPMKDTPKETTSIESERLHTSPTSTDEVIMPTKKVGCILVTSHLKQFLEDYPSSSEKKSSKIFTTCYHC